MEVSLRLENLETSVKHTRSNTSRPLRTIQGLKDRLKGLWILWRELWKKARATPTEFFQVYRIIPNNKTPASQSPVEVMFAHRIRSFYDKILPKQVKPGRTYIVPPKWYNHGDKYFQNLQRQQIFLRDGNDRKKIWEHDIYYKGTTI